jgi:protein required for attachment to host cells
MAATWIVSANASKARFFSQENASAPLEEINDMINDAAHLRTLESDDTDKGSPRSASKSVHGSGGAMPTNLYEPAQTPEKHDAELFARDIIKFLQEAHHQGRFDHLSLVVPPQFLGMVRALLGKELESVVNLEINKDYTHFNGEQLREQIRLH